MRVETVIQFDASVDHLTGEEIGQALEVLSTSSPALDVLYLTGVGKKNRPAALLQVLCREEDEIAVRDAIFRHTHTLGLRRARVERYVLERETGETTFLGEKLPVKIYSLENATYARIEADAVKSLARKKGIGAPALRFYQNRLRRETSRPAPKKRLVRGKKS